MARFSIRNAIASPRVTPEGVTVVVYARVPAWLRAVLMVFAALFLLVGVYALFDVLTASDGGSLRRSTKGLLAAGGMFAAGFLALFVVLSGGCGLGVASDGAFVLFNRLTSRRIQSTPEHILRTRQAGGRSTRWQVVLQLPGGVPEILYYARGPDDARQRCTELATLAAARGCPVRVQ